MGVDQHREHAEGFVVFDEAHAAHVGGEVVDFAHSVAGTLASFAELEIGLDVFDVVEDLIPLVERFDVDAADVLVALVAEMGDQVSTDETTAASNEN